MSPFDVVFIVLQWGAALVLIVLILVILFVILAGTIQGVVKVVKSMRRKRGSKIL